MGKPHVHAKSSAQRFGGKPEDYLDIHELLDSSRSAFGDLRHRALTHNPWFVETVLVRLFGRTRTNSIGREYSVTEVAEWHILEDFGGKFIPNVQDFLERIEFADWMDNGKSDNPPPSAEKLLEWQKRRPLPHVHVHEAGDCGGDGKMD